MASAWNQIGAWDYGRLIGRLRSRSGAESVSAQAPADAVQQQSAVAPAAHAAGFYALKTRLHQKLLTRMDLAAAEAMPPEQLRQQLSELVARLIEEDALPVNARERQQLVGELQHEVLGLGPLEPLMADPSISDIIVNGYDQVFVERGGLLSLTDVRFDDDEHVKKIIDKIVSRVGRRIDEACPMADARLPDGSRVNAIIPPVALDGPSISIRRFAVVPLRMTDLIARHSLTREMAELLSGLVKAEANIVISGGTGSGKTTLLNILSSYIPDGDRIITIEDTAELQMQQNHVVRLETRPPNIEGKGEITMRALVKNALRMRPDRIVLGEVRSSEVIDMLQAMNTGHDGSLTTIHANNPREALGRLENLIGLGGISMPPRAIRQQISAAVDLIVQVGRLSDGSRKITSITEVTGMELDVIATQEIFLFEQTGIDERGRVLGRFLATGVRPRLSDKMRAFGIELAEDLFDPQRPLE